MDRRRFLRTGGLALAATVIAPAAASAATDEGGLLLGLWRREKGAALAYDRVAHLEPLFITLRGHEADHAAAIATELAAVGLGTPREPEWVGEIDVAAEQLARADAKSAPRGRPGARGGARRALSRRAPEPARLEDRDDRGDDPGVALPARTHPPAPD